MPSRTCHRVSSPQLEGLFSLVSLSIQVFWIMWKMIEVSIHQPYCLWAFLSPTCWNIFLTLVNSGKGSILTSMHPRHFPEEGKQEGVEWLAEGHTGRAMAWEIVSLLTLRWMDTDSHLPTLADWTLTQPCKGPVGSLDPLGEHPEANHVTEFNHEHMLPWLNFEGLSQEMYY